MHLDNLGFIRLYEVLAKSSDFYNSAQTRDQVFDFRTCDQKSVSDLSSMSIDSRQCDERTLFVALPGHHNDGKAYISDAVLKGCVVILCECDTAHGQSVSTNSIECSDGSKRFYLQLDVLKLNSLLADLAEAFFALSKDIACYAVTGTNGKTTVANIAAQLSSLSNTPAASIGTLGVLAYSGKEFRKVANTINTTPDLCSLYRFVSRLHIDGVKNVLLEASSHGIAQGRLGKLMVSTAIFTNLSQDHLDYHHTMERYAQAKRGLMSANGMRSIVLNYDDDESLNWQKTAPNQAKQYWYSSTQRFDLDLYQGCYVSELEYNYAGLKAIICSTWGSHVINLPLLGNFNLANFLAAFTALCANGYSAPELAKNCTLLKGASGRMELFSHSNSNRKGNIIVDYAHTPDALKQALIAARAHTKGQLICVFGCGGDRDTSKRSIMGQMAEKYADKVVVTEDNSRTENIKDIIKDITQHMNGNNVVVEHNRRLAIQKAWQISGEGDLVLLAGKGHEEYIEVDGQQSYYSERAFVQELLAGQVFNGNQLSAAQRGDGL